MKLLTISENTILLNKSQIYLRVLFIINCFTIYILLTSSILWIIKFFFILVILLQFRKVYSNPKPNAEIEYVIIKQDSWILQTTSKCNLEYENARTLIDTGLFQLIAFTDPTLKKKILIIFQDQITEIENRNIQKIMFLK